LATEQDDLSDVLRGCPVARRNVANWIAVLLLVIIAAIAVGAAYRSVGEAVAGPQGEYPPTLRGSAGDLNVWHWSDGVVECVIVTTKANVDAVCHAVPPAGAPKEEPESARFPDV
jgi:hypothetical protein